jgi:hypothetical protein
MKKKFMLGVLLLVVGACCIATLHRAHAAGGPDVWIVGPNCQGVKNTEQHVCEFSRTQLHVGEDHTPYDQWTIVVIEPSTVTGVTCQIMAPNMMPYMGAFGGDKANPWAGSHYGNVGICRGWINGGNGPLKITATY